MNSFQESISICSLSRNLHFFSKGSNAFRKATRKVKILRTESTMMSTRDGHQHQARRLRRGETPARSVDCVACLKKHSNYIALNSRGRCGTLAAAQAVQKSRRSAPICGRAPLHRRGANAGHPRELLRKPCRFRCHQAAEGVADGVRRARHVFRQRDRDARCRQINRQHEIQPCWRISQPTFVAGKTTY